MAHVRDATAADVPAIRGLYNALIPTTTVAWRDDPATVEEMEAWFGDRLRSGDPVLVAEVDGTVVGYTCWSTFRGGDRLPGYRHTAELAIHVSADHHGRGIGRTLLTALVEEASRPPGCRRSGPSSAAGSTSSSCSGSSTEQPTGR